MATIGDPKTVLQSDAIFAELEGIKRQERELRDKLSSLRSRKAELRALLPPRVTMSSFSRPLRARQSAHRAEGRELRLQLRQLNSEGSRNRDDPLLVGLSADIAAHREARKQQRALDREVIAELRAELKTMRQARTKKDLDAVTDSENAHEVADPWVERLPKMHLLFPGRSERQRLRCFKELTSRLATGSAAEGLSAVVQLVDEEMRRACPQPLAMDFNALEALAWAFGQQSVFCQLVRLVLSDDALLERVVSDSYHHDLFDKTVLLSGKETNWKLRLHVFRPESFTVSQEEVHSHRNHFASHILHGGFTHQLWEPASPGDEDAKELYKYVYDPLVAEDGTRMFHIEPKGKVRLRLEDEQTVKAGDTYYMHPSVLHAVTGLDGRTMTCVLNSPQVSERSCFSTHEVWEEEMFTRERFTVEEMQAQLKDVLNVVQTRGALPGTDDSAMDVDTGSGGQRRRVRRGENR
uniref:Uncharacterized protein n=1 Tax=Chromera velia CCMP2878 TaxID=1169474 RepID=A0A0G4HDW6_9ALVE|eukprot:Cvel_6496.t1-p1 / transcript=Cvel_6496.t1 / gene=Cvel_6496 / organism=Chromera_velia_CCMP2878 / gene_product=hypothetical protein / transcript_product=hypothetical protein / location=Cvel_scaffold318:93233-94627(+) / protein_length=465 / sequence_SO=supercontig / SO=protein_coding / is_pseudo=false